MEPTEGSETPAAAETASAEAPQASEAAALAAQLTERITELERARKGW
jgi:hypothetical protein